jgi:hypothetical protein
MKYVLSLLVGIVAGAALAIAALYFNPLTQGDAEPEGTPDWTFDFAITPAATWIATHDERLDLPVVPADVPLLWEDGIKGSLLTALPLHDASGRFAAFGSRITVPSAATEFLSAGLLVDDYWLISIPGQGSVFVHAVNNDWPLVRDTLVRVDLLRRDWQGPGNYAPTVGPGDAGASVTGLSGSLAGRTGHGRERLTLAHYNGSLSALSGEIVLDLEGQAAR